MEQSKHEAGRPVLLTTVILFPADEDHICLYLSVIRSLHSICDPRRNVSVFAGWLSAPVSVSGLRFEAKAVKA